MPVSPASAAMENEADSRDAEQALLQRWAAGDAGAFTQLVAEHRQRITRLVYRLLGWRGEVEDVVQEVFLVAYRKLASFRGESSLATWLAGIAINRCRAYRRRWLPGWTWLEQLWRRRQRATPPDDALLADETVARVRSAVRQLPAADREVIVLYYLEDVPVAQIAGLLRASSGAVEVRLHRARQRLRRLLGEFGQESS